MVQRRNLHELHPRFFEKLGKANPIGRIDRQLGSLGNVDILGRERRSPHSKPIKDGPEGMGSYEECASREDPVHGEGSERCELLGRHDCVTFAAKQPRGTDCITCFDYSRFPVGHQGIAFRRSRLAADVFIALAAGMVVELPDQEGLARAVRPDCDRSWRACENPMPVQVQRMVFQVGVRSRQARRMLAIKRVGQARIL